MDFCEHLLPAVATQIVSRGASLIKSNSFELDLMILPEAVAFPGCSRAGTLVWLLDGDRDA